MRLYREDGHSFSFNEGQVLGEGSFGKTYKLPDDTCYKIFNNSISRKEESSEFSEEVFNILKTLKLKNFYELYEIFYNRGLTRVTGYSSKYYKPEEIDILTMPTDYTLNSLYNIYESIQKMSEQKILITDMHEGNAILDSNKVTIIDTDLYYKSIFNYDKKEILNSNIYSLYSLFMKIYYDAIDKYHEQDFKHLSKKVDDLFFPKRVNNVDTICKKLIKYKYPIDYLRKK